MSPRKTRVSTRRRRRQRRGCSLWLLLVVAVVAAGFGALAYRYWPYLLPVPARVGIIAGHWQNDSGATCADGLREVDITLPVAEAVVANLRLLGYDAVVLPEVGRELAGFRGLALVSLHADSCLPGLTGYKVAGRSVGPAAPASARLVEALCRSYEAETGLSFHYNTVTPAMTQYHAFFEIDPATPAAIVEMGFMGGDRMLLTEKRQVVVRGLVNGLIEYLKARRE
ncbi:MAG: N-acetylmuramoyl-L-alanine amidase [Anaerolineae bacterium]